MRLRNYIKIMSTAALAVFLFIQTANADTLGQRITFFIDPQFDDQKDATLSATLKLISRHAYFYIGDDYWNKLAGDQRASALNSINDLASEFDNRIYPTERKHFGSEPLPGIDNDERITILLTPLIENAGGYYDTTNQYSRQLVPQSNQRELIYLNALALNQQRKVSSFLAHEFQHLISFNEKEITRDTSDDIWLNELRSEYALTLLGYNDNFNGSSLERRLLHLLNSPYDSLTEWKNLSPDYGQVAMFGEYLAERTSAKVITDTLKNNLPGIRSINESLKQNGFSTSFAEIYRDWLIANILNDNSKGIGFGFIKNELNSFRVKPSNILRNLGNDVIFEINDNVKDWAGGWYEVSDFMSGPGQDGSDILKIDITSSSITSFRISIIIFNNDGSVTARDFDPSSSANSFYLDGINTNFNKVIIMPFKKDRLSGFSSNETAISIHIDIKRIDEIPANSIAIDRPAAVMTDTDNSTADSVTENTQTNLPEFADGALLRAKGDAKVYVINGKWRRHIVSPRIFDFYPHLGFDKVIEVEPEIIADYKESRLIRYAEDEKVYEVSGTDAKRWLNITPEQFISQGYKWDQIFIINDLELGYYR
ncbi:MAG: hypothetical protein Q8Q06_00740 [bacterium]|nr:hypothetical protein [bacterium]